MTSILTGSVASIKWGRFTATLACFLGSAFFPLCLADRSAAAPPPIASPIPAVSSGVVETTARARDVVNILKTFYPPVEGHVMEIGSGGQVTLDHGEDVGFYPGTMVMIYRPGPAFRDFYTGIVIGHREEKVGWVEVRSVGATSSRGIFRGAGTVRSGDGYRLPASLVRIALVPASRYADLAVMSHLTRAIGKSGRFTVVDPFRVDLAMRKMGKGSLKDPAYRVALAKNLGAQGLVLVDTTLLGDQVMIDLNVDGAITGEKAFTLHTILEGVHPLSGSLTGGSLLAGASPDLHAAKLPPLSVPVRTVKIPLIPFFLGEGHLIPGAGPVTVLSDGRRIIVGTIGSNRIRTHYRESDARVPGNRHVFISVGPVIPPDKDHPGVEQVAVTNIVGGSPDSYVLDYDGKTFRRIAKHLPWYIRIVRLSDGKSRLIAQRMGVNKAFLGHIHFLRWKLDHFEKGAAVPWPKVITLLGTQPVRTGTQNAFLKIASDNHLEYYDSRGDLRFKSPIFLGGYSNHFVFGRPHALLPVQSRSVRVKGRILILSPEKGSGRPVAIVYKNIPMSSGFGNFQGFQYGQVYFYRWTGVNWVLLGELTRVKNFIRDIAIVADRKTGQPLLEVGTEPVFNFMNIQNLIVKEGSVLFFALPKEVRQALEPSGKSPALTNRPEGSRTGR